MERVILSHRPTPRFLANPASGVLRHIGKGEKAGRPQGASPKMKPQSTTAIPRKRSIWNPMYNLKRGEKAAGIGSQDAKNNTVVYYRESSQAQHFEP